MVQTEEKVKINKKTKASQIGSSAMKFNNYIDDFFGLIIIISVVLIFVAAFFLFVNPRWQQSTNTIADTRGQLEDERDQLVKYKDGIKEYKEKYSDISEADRKKVSNMIGPLQKHPSIYHTDLVITFRELFQSRGYTLLNLKVSEQELRDGAIKKTKTGKVSGDEKSTDLPQDIIVMKIELEFEGVTYDNLKELLSLLERKLRLTDVISISFNPEGGSCSIELATYRFSE